MSMMPLMPAAVESPRAPRNPLAPPTQPGERRSAQKATAAPVTDFPAELARRQPALDQPAAVEPESPPSPLNPPPELQKELEVSILGAKFDNEIAASAVDEKSASLAADTAQIPAADRQVATNVVPAVLRQGLAVAKQQIAPAGTGQPTPKAEVTSPASFTDSAPARTEALPNLTAVAEAPAAKTPIGVATAPAGESLPLTVSAEPTAPAVAWEAATKGRGTYTQAKYTQAPVVNESQLMAASLKENARPAPTAVNIAETGQNNGGPELMATGNDAQADRESAAGDPDHLDAPPAGAALSSAPAAGVSDEGASRVAPELAPVPAAEAGADLETVSLAVDATVTAASGTTSRPPTASTGTETSVSRSVRQQVVRQIAGRLEGLSGQDKVTIKLNPETLGQVELKFSAKEDRLAVVISASGTEAEAALQENLKDLSDRIVERSVRFSHVEVRVEIKDSADSRQDGKQDAKQDGRQDQRRDQSQRDDTEPDNRQHHSRQARQSQQAWESAMSWHLADQAGSEEG